jgi:hypothetical protein
VTDRLGLAVPPAQRSRAVEALLDDVTSRLLDRHGAGEPHVAHGLRANFAQRRYPRPGVSALVSRTSKTIGDVRDV